MSPKGERKFSLGHTIKTYRGIKRMDPLIFNFGTGWIRMVKFTPPSALLPRKNRYTLNRNWVDPGDDRTFRKNRSLPSLLGVNTCYVAANCVVSCNSLWLSLAQIQLSTCVSVHTPPTPLEKKMSVLSATLLFWGRVVVPEISFRLLSTEERAQIQAGLRGICGSWRGNGNVFLK
jgi:hypothetical protein